MRKSRWRTLTAVANGLALEGEGRRRVVEHQREDASEIRRDERLTLPHASISVPGAGPAQVSSDRVGEAGSRFLFLSQVHQMALPPELSTSSVFKSFVASVFMNSS